MVVISSGINASNITKTAATESSASTVMLTASGKPKEKRRFVYKVYGRMIIYSLGQHSSATIALLL